MESDEPSPERAPGYRGKGLRPDISGRHPSPKRASGNCAVRIKMRFLMLMGKLPVRLTKRVRLERYLENAVLRILHVSPLSRTQRPWSLPGFEPRMLFLECQSKGAGNLSPLFTYEISDQKSGPEQKQRNVPVWAIHGQYSSGLPVCRFKSIIDLQYRMATPGSLVVATSGLVPGGCYCL